jgi:hypothetical protein
VVDCLLGDRRGRRTHDSPLCLGTVELFQARKFKARVFDQAKLFLVFDFFASLPKEKIGAGKHWLAKSTQPRRGDGRTAAVSSIGFGAPRDPKRSGARRWRAIDGYGVREAIRCIEDMIADDLIAAKRRGTSRVRVGWNGHAPGIERLE